MRQGLRLVPAAALVFALAAVGGCRERGAKAVKPQPGLPQKLDASHLPNAFRIHEKVISGGQPGGEAAFRELKELGVKTVISVDGAKPEVELAKKYGLKYVHLPHGYDGIPDERAKELAKAVRDLEGPIYIHCHHGKHRSPAATAVACVSAGLIEPSASLSILRAAGTSENYRGLYKSAESARKLDDALLDALQAEFPETARLPPLAEAMVALEHTHDHLKLIAANEWKRPASHPDLDPPHEALLLREHFTEMLRTDAVQREPEEFRDLLRDSEAAAQELEMAIGKWQQFAPPVPEAIPASFARMTNNCTTCHRKFRDVPLGEKNAEN
ncbi:MAG TPA: hypothetical protein VMP01_29430 [Pirellulaceae bacterium]|nr:hypothetical protein [Pirellulaceae bacterium]